MTYNATFMQFVNPEDVENWSLLYFLWCLGGMMSGMGLAEFPLIINTLHWSPAEKAGTNQALFAGLGNITPGIFLVVIAIVQNFITLKTIFIFWFLG
jgi:NNP family nitrate/nitrite transporter-like MFS transporter